MRTLTVTVAQGFRLDVQVSGRSTGPTLLLLAGQANSHRWWTSLRADFEDDFRVVTMDQRGTGASKGEVTDWSTDLFADEGERYQPPTLVLYDGAVQSACGFNSAALQALKRAPSGYA